MQATTFNYAQNISANHTMKIVRAEAMKKIVMFSAILTCLVAAVNL